MSPSILLAWFTSLDVFLESQFCVDVHAKVLLAGCCSQRCSAHGVVLTGVLSTEVHDLTLVLVKT